MYKIYIFRGIDVYAKMSEHKGGGWGGGVKEGNKEINT